MCVVCQGDANVRLQKGKGKKINSYGTSIVRRKTQSFGEISCKGRLKENISCSSLNAPTTIHSLERVRAYMLQYIYKYFTVSYNILNVTRRRFPILRTAYIIDTYTACRQKNSQTYEKKVMLNLYFIQCLYDNFIQSLRITYNILFISLLKIYFLIDIR